MPFNRSGNRHIYETDLQSMIQDADQTGFNVVMTSLHPQDQMDVYIHLSEQERLFLYGAMPPQAFAPVFQELDVLDQTRYIHELDEDYARAVIRHMASDKAADFLLQTRQDKVSRLLEESDDVFSRNIKELLTYEEETAGSIMTKEFISLRTTDRISDVIAMLRVEGPKAETIYYLYVIDNRHKLVGVASLRDLIVAEPGAFVQDVMSTRVISVRALDDQEDVAHLFKKYDFLAIPVVTEKRKLIGIITVDDILDVMEAEQTEDLGEFAASRGATDLSLSPVTAAKKRAPWIILLMFFGMITAGVIGQFEETLETIVLLAGFIPLIMDSAGNTGTQSLAVAVRSLALGTAEKKGVRNMIAREFSTGVMLGLMCAVTLIVIVPVIYPGEFLLAGIVAVSILLSLSLATVIGTVVPLIIHKLKLDPAIASGPFITTVNDIIGLMIYFTIATSLLQYL